MQHFPSRTHSFSHHCLLSGCVCVYLLTHRFGPLLCFHFERLHVFLMLALMLHDIVLNTLVVSLVLFAVT